MEDFACGCRNSGSHERGVYPVTSHPMFENAVLSRPAKKNPAESQNGTDKPSALWVAHMDSPAPLHGPRHASGSPATPSFKGLTAGKDSPSMTPKQKRCVTCESAIDPGAKVCEMCGDAQTAPRKPKPQSQKEEEPLTWYGTMGVRIRGRDGDVREITLPMPGKFIKEDTSVLEWLTRPADAKPPARTM